VHSNNDDPTGRHPGKTQAAIPKALNERADLVGQSYRERHRGQRAIGLQLEAGHMGAPLLYGVRLERALDRGVVPHMGIPRLQESAKVVLSSRIQLLIEDMLTRWLALDERIAAFDAEFAVEAKRDEAARRLAATGRWRSRHLRMKALRRISISLGVAA
jgi:hypothetical protein